MDFRDVPVLITGRTIWDQLQLPEEEFTDRHAAVRALMDKEGLEGLLIYSNGLETGSVCYLTNFHCYVPWADALYVFPKEGKPVLVASLAPREIETTKKYLAPDVDLQVAGLSLVSNHHLAQKVVDYLAERNLAKRKWGGVNLHGLSHMAAPLIKEAIGAVADYTGEFNKIRMCKSIRELSLLSQVSHMAKWGAMELTRACLPGKNEFEVTAAIERQLRINGAEEVNILISSGKSLGSFHKAYNSSFEAADSVQVFVAVRYLRYWGIFGTSAVIGKASSEQKALYAEARKLLNNAVEDIGKTKKIAKNWLSNLETEYSLLPYSRITGVGLDMAEEPYEGEIESGTTLNLTLGLEKGGKESMFVSESFVIRDGGASMLSGITNEKLLYVQP